MINLESLPAEKWLEMNAALQKKKNAARKKLNEMGVVKRDKVNKYDNYSYLSESGYKQIFTELFSENGLELKSDEVDYKAYTGNGNQQSGRMVKIRFTLFDIDTGFFETTDVTGEAIDRGDKAGYKAYTGALKYYLANTFMVASGDDAEKHSPEKEIQNEQPVQEKPKRKINKKQIGLIYAKFQGKEASLTKILKKNKVSRVEDLSYSQAIDLLDQINKKEMKANEVTGNQPSNS